jgi:hypothetical protein
MNRMAVFLVVMLLTLDGCAASGVHKAPSSGASVAPAAVAATPPPASATPAAVVATPPAPAQPMIFLYKDINFAGGEVHYNADNKNILGSISGQASSIRVEGDVWVVVYSQAGFTGSELRIRGPWESSNLTQIVKKNGPCVGGTTTAPPGDWNDEIVSLRFFPANWGGADGCGTNCPGPGYCGPPR